LLNEASRRGLLRLRAMGLNQLAMVQRHRNEPVAAQHTLEECVELCRRIGYVQVEVLNTNNLGNTFLDQMRSPEAEQTYLRALAKARDYNLQTDAAHSLELLARLRHRQTKYEEAVSFASEALTLHRQYSEPLRVATSSRALALALEELKRYQEAAEHFEEAAENHERSGLWQEAAYDHQMAASCWNVVRQASHALVCVSRGVNAAIQATNPERASDVLTEAPADSGGGVAALYVDTIRLFLRRGRRGKGLAYCLLNFCTHCKRSQDARERSQFLVGLQLLVNTVCEKPDAQPMNALAIAIEQATDDLLPDAVLHSILQRIAVAVPSFVGCLDNDVVPVWTLRFDWRRPLELRVIPLNVDGIAQRMGMALSLLLFANRKLIEDVVQEFGDNQEEVFELYIVTQADFEQQVGQVLDTQEEPHSGSSLLLSCVPWGETQPPTTLILHNDYEMRSDWAVNPGNKAFVWVLMNVHGSLVSHCVHADRQAEDGRQLARLARKFCEVALL
jgi:tetratricopeptide (TPR) repeat protein